MFRFWLRRRKTKRPIYDKKPSTEVLVGSVIGQVWDRVSKRGKHYSVVSFGRFKAYNEKMYVTRFLYLSDLDDLVEVIRGIHESVEKKPKRIR